MADLRPSFVTLEDVGTQAGVPLHRAVEGDVAAGKNAHGALVAKRQDTGVLRYIPLSVNDAIPVTFDMTGQAYLSDEGGVSGTTSFQTLVEIPLVNDAVYSKVAFSGSCFRDAVCEVVQIDDTGGTPIETVHLTFRVGPGHVNETDELDSLQLTAGSTGTCVLRVRAKQLQNAASDIDGMLAVFEQQ